MSIPILWLTLPTEMYLKTFRSYPSSTKATSHLIYSCSHPIFSSLTSCSLYLIAIIFKIDHIVSLFRPSKLCKKLFIEILDCSLHTLIVQLNQTGMICFRGWKDHENCSILFFPYLAHLPWSSFIGRTVDNIPAFLSSASLHYLWY